MTEEERKRYFGALIEILYDNLQALQESNVPEKKEKAAKIVYDFYIDHKEEYNIKDIKEVIKGLDQINEKMDKTRKKEDIKNMYDQEKMEDR